MKSDELKQEFHSFLRDEEQEWDVYNQDTVNQKLLNDEIDPEEEAFLRGYMEEWS